MEFEFERLHKTFKRLIIGDSGLIPVDQQIRSALMEIVGDRHKRASMIITSQLSVNCRHEVVGEKTIADAIVDRIVHDSHRVELKEEFLIKTTDRQKTMKSMN